MAQWRDRWVLRVLQGSGSKWSSVHTCHRCPERRSPAWVKATLHARASKHCEYILRLQKSCCYYHTSAMCCQRKSAWFTFYRVKDLDAQIGPERQRMVYQNFIKPFLARNSTTDGTVFCALIFSYSLRKMFWLWVFLTLSFCFKVGCVRSASSIVEWFVQNFQNFSTIASLGDFKTFNNDFTGVSE